MKIEEVDADSPSFVWAARVPSDSNVADLPSRGSLNGLDFLGEISVVAPVCPLTSETMVSVVSAEAKLGNRTVQMWT